MWKWLQHLNGRFAPQRLSRSRVFAAVGVAVAVDALQLLTAELIPLPEILDVAAMILTTLALGFHVLLLPTFVIELIPLVDIAPTWTGCVAAVILLRKRAEKAGQPSAPDKPAIDI